jgi:hypothetical protein
VSTGVDQARDAAGRQGSVAARPGEPGADQPIPGSTSSARWRFRRWARRLRPDAPARPGDLDPVGRIIYWSIITVLALAPLLSALVILRQGWRPMGDNALIGLRVHDVLQGHFPLIGQPTTGETFGAVATSHPGPIEFYAVAPFVAVLGPIVGLVLGAAIINSVALAGIGWAAFRRGGLELMGLTAVCMFALTRSLGGNQLHDPVSSNIGAINAVLLMFLGWCIVAGDLDAAPAFVLAGSFAMQNHLTNLGTGGPLVLVALVVGVWWARQIWRRTKDHAWLRRKLVIASVLGVVLWLPVFIDELFGQHNLSHILQTFTGGAKRDGSTGGGTKGAGVAFAWKRMGDALAPWPTFSHRHASLGWLHTPSTLEIVTGYLVVAAVVALGIHFLRQHRTELAALAFVVLIGLAAGFNNAVKLPGNGAGIKASNLQWMWTVSAFTWIALLWLVWQALKPAWRSFLALPLITLGAVLALMGLVGTVSSIDLHTDRDGVAAADAGALFDRVVARLPKGTYRVDYGGKDVVLSVGPGLVHALDGAGYHPLVDLGPFNRAYGAGRTFHPDMDIKGTLLVTTETEGAGYDDSSRPIARQRMRFNRNDTDSLVVRVFLQRGSS